MAAALASAYHRRFLLLDEPITGLDPLVRVGVIETAAGQVCDSVFRWPVRIVVKIRTVVGCGRTRTSFISYSPSGEFMIWIESLIVKRPNTAIVVFVHRCAKTEHFPPPARQSLQSLTHGRRRACLVGYD